MSRRLRGSMKYTSKLVYESAARPRMNYRPVGGMKAARCAAGGADPRAALGLASVAHSVGMGRRYAAQ